jgi:hypothetical protein
MARAVSAVRRPRYEPDSVAELDPVEWVRTHAAPGDAASATAPFGDVHSGEGPSRAASPPRTAIAGARARAPLRVLRVPEEQLQRLLVRSARMVADLPVGSTSVVWTDADSELLVLTDRVRVMCGDGLVTITVPVGCDRLPAASPAGPAPIAVTFAVGSRRRAAGLVMSTTARPSGPQPVVARWADALVAYAYETLIHATAGLAAASGKDRSGRVLIPSAITALPGGLLISTMARHTIRWSQ